MLKCIIVEDEFPAREELKFFISQNKEIELVSEFENPIDALKYMQKNLNIDIIFLDINMPEIDGVNLAKILYKLNPKLRIVFITAYREHAVEAFEIKAFDYILKPYSSERITKLLDNLVNSEDDESVKLPQINKITVSANDKLVVLSLDEICYIEIVEKESLVYTEKACFTSKLNLCKWEELLPITKFYRSHRSYIINLDKIIEIEPWFNGTYLVKLKNMKTKIPVSRNNIRQFKELFSIK